MRAESAALFAEDPAHFARDTGTSARGSDGSADHDHGSCAHCASSISSRPSPFSQSSVGSLHVTDETRRRWCWKGCIPAAPPRPTSTGGWCNATNAATASNAMLMMRTRLFRDLSWYQVQHPSRNFRAKGQLRTSQCMRARSAPTRPLPHETLPHAALVLFTHSQGLLTTSNKAANLGSRLTLHAPLPQLNTSTQRSHTNATPSTQSCTVTGLKPIPMLKA